MTPYTQVAVECVSALATAIAITGVVMNNRRLRTCFILWVVSNAISLAIHLHAHLFSLAFRDAVFLCLAVEGWVRWGKKP